jgi:threonine dehydratase
MYGDYIMLPAWMRGAVSDQERSCVTTVQNAFNEITKCDIEVAFRAIRVHVRRTPVIEICGSELGLQKFRLTLKLESMQYAGSFKTRGAMTNLLLRDIPPAGVTAASGGNHGAAVAYAAMKLGVPARIFVPRISSPAKIRRIREFRADLVVGGDCYADALSAAEKWTAESGSLPVHAFDQRETLLGQGTLGMEFEEQAPTLNTVLSSVGGGGLVGGIAAWFQGKIRVVGVEPEASPTLSKALSAGRPVDCEAGGLAADSLAPRRIGEAVYPIAARYVAKVVLVSDDDIRSAQLVLWDKLRIVAEPGGAAAFAALLSRKYQPAEGDHVGVVISGGNTIAVDFALQEKKYDQE